MRLQKFLAQGGVASRRRAEDLIKKGGVRVNGEVVSTLGRTIDPDRDTVELEGKRVRVAPVAYRILLKPRGCLATLADSPPDSDRPTLARYVRDREVGWQIVAPLDFPAEGVLLLTTDGALAEKMSRGGGAVTMTYHLKYQKLVTDDDIGRLLRGWKFERRSVRPEAVVALATTGKNSWVEMVIREMRPRVLKASGEAIRKTVLKISRVKLGPLSFEGLSMGESRDLTKAEVNALRRAAGMAAPAPISGEETATKSGRKPARAPSRL
jgi:23S rRNA pseudouridine2605 synthase